MWRAWVGGLQYRVSSWQDALASSLRSDTDCNTTLSIRHAYRTPPMMTSRTTLLAFSLAFAAACASGNQQPEGGTAARPDGRRPSVLDSMRANRVIENARPDAPARAGLLVVANQQGASATVLDASNLKTLATVTVGIGPHEVAISPDGRWAAVTNYGNREVNGNTISVIDLSAPTLSVVRTIDLGEYHRPHGAAFIQDGRKLVVTSETSQRLVIVDFASGKVDTALATNARGSHMVAVRRDGKRAWTANIGDGSVTEFDLDARTTVRTIPAASNDEGIATTPGGILLWVGSNTEKTVTVIDTQRGEKTATLTGFGMPYRIGISRTGRVAVVCDPTSNLVWLFEVGSNRELAKIDLGKEKGITLVPGGQAGQPGAGPEGVTFDPIADIAYITLNGSNQVLALDLESRKVTAVGAVGAGPDGIAFSPLVRK
jgi:YVTN family beta-propeller protein